MNLIFDFGGVLIDWDPHHLYDPYFGDRARAEWFLQNICTTEWNTQMDGGKPFAEGIAELSARFPEWSREIEMFHSQWTKMVGGPIPGMLELVRELKAAGHRLYGLSNWSAETFPLICDDYPALKLLDGMVISGFESAGGAASANDCGGAGARTSGRAPLIKPDPEIYKLLLSRYSLQPADCIFIDDNPANIAAARALGIRAIRFTTCSNLRAQLLQLLDSHAATL